MNKFKRGHEFLSKAARYVVDHFYCVVDFPEPEFSAHFFLVELDLGHFYGGAPCLFHKTVHNFLIGGSGNYGRFVLVDQTEGVSANEFSVEVRVESFFGVFRHMLRLVITC